MLAPLKVKVPAPTLVKASVAFVPSCNTPLKLVLVPSLPAVKVIVPLEAVVVIVPAPAIEPTVSEAFTL